MTNPPPGAAVPQATAVKFRAHDWINTKSGKTRYGVQAFCNGKWMHVGKSGKNGFTPKFFRTPQSREAWLSDQRIFGGSDALLSARGEPK